MTASVTFEDRYSTARTPLVSWVLESLDLSRVRAAAEIGCGTGRFTLPLARALAAQATPCDRGAIVHALDRDWRALQRLQSLAESESLSIEAKRVDLPGFAIESNGGLDLVLAPFVLHLLRPPAVDEVLGDVRDWLRPTGRLLVVGYGAAHMREVYDWLAEALHRTGLTTQDACHRAEQVERGRVRRPGFALERGIGSIGLHFNNVNYRRFDDKLRAPVNAVEELVGPTLIPAACRNGEVSSSDLQPALAAVLASRGTDGLLTLGVDIAMITATNPRQSRTAEIKSG